MTYTINNPQCLIKEVKAHIHDITTMRRNVLNLVDGYYLSVLTGSHSYAAIEVALMKDGKFIKDDDFAIINFYEIADFITMLKKVDEAIEDGKTDIEKVWENIFFDGSYE